jgi:hypothetical protein
MYRNTYFGHILPCWVKISIQTKDINFRTSEGMAWLAAHYEYTVICLIKLIPYFVSEYYGWFPFML